VHRHFAPTVAGYALSAITASLVAVQWPIFGGALAAAVTLGGITDLAGGRSWVRHLTPRRGHRNVLLWAHTKAPDPTPGPWPCQATDDTPKKQVLLVLPDHPNRRSASLMTGLGAFFGLVASGAILATNLLHPTTAATVLAATAVALVFISVVAIAIDRRPGRPRSARGIAAARDIIEALPPLEHARVGIVIVGGLEPWFDGIEVLLHSRRRRLPPDRTQLLVWHPAPGPLQKVDTDGAFRKAAPVHLTAATQHLPTATHRWLRPRRTGALRARRMGWSALGLVGGDHDPDAIDALARILHSVADRP